VRGNSKLNIDLRHIVTLIRTLWIVNRV
jgi:hypothetical protein